MFQTKKGQSNQPLLRSDSHEYNSVLVIKHRPENSEYVLFLSEDPSTYESFSVSDLLPQHTKHPLQLSFKHYLDSLREACDHSDWDSLLDQVLHGKVVQPYDV